MTSLKKKTAQTMLLAILILSGLFLMVGVGLASTGSTSLNISLKEQDSLDSYYSAESCLQKALLDGSRTVFDPNFTLEGQGCTIEVTGNNPYRIVATSRVGQVIRKFSADVSVDKEVISISGIKFAD